MAQTTIANLPAASSLSGAEFFPVDQTNPDTTITTRKAAVNQIAAAVAATALDARVLSSFVTGFFLSQS